MALTALLGMILYATLFDWMEVFIRTVEHTATGYVWFNLFSQFLCLALMLPVTICAGMTLPLITATLLRAGAGEAAIGRVYAVNTAGAIAGILLAVHIVMPVLGLRQVIVVGAAIDLVLGLWLLQRSVPQLRWERALLAMLLVTATLTALLARFDPAKLASGVFRYGYAQIERRVLFHRDGKTASIDVLHSPESGHISISTNGKIDAAIDPREASQDDYTMVMLGAVPLVLHPRPAEVAVIGFGSGRTTHTLLHDPRVARVDTIEIEPAMVEGARFFGAAVRRAYEDPRSRIHYEDAKTFFARERRRYDVIVSEPSNPWVSGVASLFSTEFYEQARRVLQPGGLFVQWLHLYDIDPALVATVMQALGAQFADYQVYASNDGDLVVVARADGPVPAPTVAAFEALGPELRALLRHVDQRTLDDFRAARIGGKAVLAPYFGSFGMPANSDYFPILDQNAARHRFLASSAAELSALQPYAWRLEDAPMDLPDLTPSESFGQRDHRFQARQLARFFAWDAARGSQPQGRIDAGWLREAVALRRVHGRCGMPALEQLWLEDFRSFAARRGPYLSAADARAVATDLRGSPCLKAELKSWIDLFEAALTGDHPRVRARAPALLAAIDADEPLPEWVTVALLQADLRAGEPAVALQRVQEWGARAQSGGVRLMAAHAAAAGEDDGR